MNDMQVHCTFHACKLKFVVSKKKIVQNKKESWQVKGNL